MSVHVEEVATRVVPAPSSEDQAKASPEPRPGAAEEAWTRQLKLARRDGCRIEARGFDD